MLVIEPIFNPQEHTMKKRQKVCFFGASDRRLPLGLLILGMATMSWKSGLADDGNSTVATLPVNKVVATINLGVGVGPQGIAVSQDNKTVYVCNGDSNDVVVIDATTNQVTGTISTDGEGTPFVCVLTPDGQTLYVANNGEFQITIISTANKSVIAKIIPPLGVTGLAMAPSGKEVYATGYNNDINVIEVGSTTISKTISVGSPSAQVVFTPDGKLADVLCLELQNDFEVGTRFLATIDTKTGKAAKTNGAAGRIFYPSSITMDPAGTALYVVDQINFVTVVEPVSLKVEKAILVAPNNAEDLNPGQPAVSLNGKYLYIPYYYTLNWTSGGTQTVNYGDEVAMFDVATGKIVGSPITVGQGPSYCRFAPNGKTLYVSNWASGTVTVIDTTP
jgi:YVTN family beta-propeller protein